MRLPLDAVNLVTQGTIHEGAGLTTEVPNNCTVRCE